MSFQPRCVQQKTSSKCKCNLGRPKNGLLAWLGVHKRLKRFKTFFKKLETYPFLMSQDFYFFQQKQLSSTRSVFNTRKNGNEKSMLNGSAVFLSIQLQMLIRKRKADLSSSFLRQRHVGPAPSGGELVVTRSYQIKTNKVQLLCNFWLFKKKKQ